MAKGGGRKYNRDKNGRFASSGGSGGKSAGKASAAPASAASAGKRKIRLGANQPGVSAPQGTIAKGRTSGMMARVKGKVMGYGKGTTVTPAPAPKAKAKKGPKTAAGRASANLRNAQKQLAKNPLSKKAAMAEATARAAAEVYKARGTGRKGAAKPKRKGKK